MDKDEEIKFAKFFVDWLNKKYNFDYQAIPNNDESKMNTEVDVYAKSKSGKFKQLNFQIVTSEGVLRYEEARMCLKKKDRKLAHTGSHIKFR